MNTATNAVSRIAFAILLAMLAATLEAGEGLQREPSTRSGTAAEDCGDWHALFDGETLEGWKASEAPGTFEVANGEIIVHGPRSHLYYLGPAHGHDFTDFELELEVMTRPGANSGVYFHTEYQQEGWPTRGFEVQVNNSHADTKRTAGLYDVRDNYASVANDDEWFQLKIRVEGRHIVTFVNGRVVVDYMEPHDFVPPKDHPQRRLGSGTFALQGHDPQSEVHYRNIRVRALPSMDRSSTSSLE